MTFDEILSKAHITTIKMLEQKYDGMTNGDVIQALFPNIDKGFSNIIDLNLWWNAKYKAESEDMVPNKEEEDDCTDIYCENCRNNCNCIEYLEEQERMNEEDDE